MGLADLFRPKHRHSDSAVRVEAVHQMGGDESELVARIARDDSDPAVRRVALDKLEDPLLLADIAASERDPAVRAHAQSRASAMWVAEATAAADAGAASAAVSGLIRMGDHRALAEVVARADDAAAREAALAAIDDPRALSDLARNSAVAAEIRRIAVERIDDVEVLRGIALSEQRKEVALVALERIDAEEALEAIASKANNKSVRTRARKRLAELAGPSESEGAAAPAVEAPALSPAEVEDKRRHAERVQLARRAEGFARGSEWEQSKVEMDAIAVRWGELGEASASSAATEVSERFKRACARYQGRYDAHQQQQAKRAAAADKRRAGGAGGDTRAAGGATAEPGPTDGDAAGAADADAAGAADAAASGSDGAGVAAETGASADAADGDGAGQAAADSTGDGDSAGAASGEGGADGAAADSRRSERQARDGEKLAELISTLEGALERGKRRQIERALQQGDKIFAKLSLGPSHKQEGERFKALHQDALIKVRELREAEDWERWANVPRQEALIARAEALLADDSQERLGDQLKALQSEWKSIGPVPQKKSKELWERFKGTCDQVYERVKVERARQHEAMAENLARKEAMCEQAEALSNSTDWHETAEALKKLQREWREVGPVPRKRSDAVWKRFRAACDLFFERRKPFIEGMIAERERNLEVKTGMCERAEALAESTDWKETVAELRELQNKWRDAGLVPRKQANAINQRFRAACDRFFQRRDEHRKAEQRARERAADDVRDELQALIDGKPQVRAEAPAQASEEALPAAAEGAEAAAESASAGDEAGEAGGEVTEAGEATESAADGDAAAAASSDGGDAGGETMSPRDRLLAARARLRDLKLSEARERSLYELSNRAAAALLSAEPGLFQDTELDPNAIRSRKQKLCLRAEELAPASAAAPALDDVGSPEEMAERLRAALAANAMSASLAASTDGRNLADSIAELEFAWLRLGPIPGADGDKLEGRFQAACERARALVG